MTPRYVRNEPGRTENLGAAIISGALAAAVGLVTFYFVRLILSREGVDEADDRELLEPRSAEE